MLPRVIDSHRLCTTSFIATIMIYLEGLVTILCSNDFNFSFCQILEKLSF